MTLSAYGVRVIWAPEWGEAVVHAESAGKAKGFYWRRVSDAWQDTRYTDLRVRRLGPPQTSEDFARVAASRGVPTWRCGDRVRFGVTTGVLVGVNACANFDVLVDPGQGDLSGQRLNVHPLDLEQVDGEVTALRSSEGGA